jgi:hypothetical protein
LHYNMSIEMTAVATPQNVAFSSINAARNLANKTIMGWVTLDAYDPANLTNLVDIRKLTSADTTSEQFFIRMGASPGDIFSFVADWTTNAGQWNMAADALPIGGKHHFAWTYNNSSASNDPVGYIDGASKALSEVSTPSGSYKSGIDNALHLGGSTTSGVSALYSYDGKLYSVLVYNRILSASEILEAYQSKLAIPFYRGLVFAPMLVGAKNVQTFDGAVLAAGNTLVDSINGAVGTPNGSPIGRADTVLTFKGVN